VTVITSGQIIIEEDENGNEVTISAAGNNVMSNRAMMTDASGSSSTSASITIKTIGSIILVSLLMLIL
jgi:hypothetical protein